MRTTGIYYQFTFIKISCRQGCRRRSTIQGDAYIFEGVGQLYDVADDLPEVERKEVYGHDPENDEWKEIPYRDSLWTDDGRLTGDVSASDDWYNVIQYGDILEAVGQAAEQRQDDLDFSVHGRVETSPTYHRMSAHINFEGDTTVHAAEDDPIDLGLRVQSGHSGFHGVKYDIGAVRQVCANGMVAFVADQHFEQTHQEPFQPGLAYHAVDSVIDGADIVEQRLQEAQERELMNQDEALLMLMDLGIDRYLENPHADLALSLEEERSGDSITLYDTYNAATRALTHHAEQDVPQYELDQGFERAASLLESGAGIPDPRELGEDLVQRRADRLIEGDAEDEAYWDGEEETVRELLEAHDLAA